MQLKKSRLATAGHMKIISMYVFSGIRQFLKLRAYCFLLICTAISIFTHQCDQPFSSVIKKENAIVMWPCNMVLSLLVKCFILNLHLSFIRFPLSELFLTCLHHDLNFLCLIRCPWLIFSSFTESQND